MRPTLARISAAALTAVALAVLSAAALWAAAPHVPAALDADGTYHLLLLGSDADPLHGQGSAVRGRNALSGRADAIHIVTVSPDRDRVTITSMPRDTRAYVGGFGRTKINAGLTRGPANMVEAVEGHTGLDIDDWMVTSFSGVVHGISDLGGVTVDVEQRLYDDYGSKSDLHPGVQTLGGPEALAYSRDRYSRGAGDIGRSTGQAKVLQALYDQYLAGSSPLDRVRLAKVLHETTATSLSARRLVALGSIASGLDADQVDRVQLNLSGGTTDGRSAASVFSALASDGQLD